MVFFFSFCMYVCHGVLFGRFGGLCLLICSSISESNSKS